MANSTLLQVRTSEEDKKRASEILESLGTNLSSVVNMLLKQIILTESIPFEIKITREAPGNLETLAEVQTTLAMEGMTLTAEDILVLKEYAAASEESREDIRRKILEE